MWTTSAILKRDVFICVCAAHKNKYDGGGGVCKIHHKAILSIRLCVRFLQIYMYVHIWLPGVGGGGNISNNAIHKKKHTRTNETH